MRGLATAVILLLTAIAAHAQCVSTNQTVSARTVEPNRAAGPIAWNGSVLAVAKTQNDPVNSIWLSTYDEQLHPVRGDVRVAETSLSGPEALLWNGTDFGLFYHHPFTTHFFQRIAADGTPIGGPVTLPHGTFPEDEFDVVWDAFREAYLVLHNITQGPETGLWLTAVARDGSVKFDRLLYTFVARPTLPRLGAAANGTIGVFFEHASVPGTSLLRIDAQERFNAPVPISSRDALRLAVGTRGNEFGIAKQTAIAGGKTEIRWLVIDTSGAVVVSERVLVSPRGVDVAPVAVLATPNEWALAYDDSVLGFRELPGEYRLRRFTQTGTTISDTQFSADALRATLHTPFPFVWTGSSYISSAALFISRAQGSDSYLLKHCPLAAAASASRTLVRLLETIEFTGSASGGGAPYTFEWDFGDNTTRETGPTATHRYDRLGTYTVTLTVTDNAGARSVATVVIRVIPGKTRAVR